MGNEVSENELYETIKGISTSDESLETLRDIILKASSELDALIMAQVGKIESHEEKT